MHAEKEKISKAEFECLKVRYREVVADEILDDFEINEIFKLDSKQSILIIVDDLYYKSINGIFVAPTIAYKQSNRYYIARYYY